MFQQMSRSIVLDMRQGLFIARPEQSSSRVIRRQKMPLLGVAWGLTDQTVAVELHINVPSVCFHKKNCAACWT